MSLGTTTWRGRNKGRLNVALDAARELGLFKPQIIEYGPGGSINFLIDWLPEGDRAGWSTTDRLQRGVVKAVESAMRKTGLFCLETSEPEEIAHIFRDLSPSKIYVVDRERKVIDAVRKIVERKNLPVSMDYNILDIEQNQFGQQGDIVVAYNIIERTNNPQAAASNIARTTRVGGLLSTTLRPAPNGFEEIGEGLYYRMN